MDKRQKLENELDNLYMELSNETNSLTEADIQIAIAEVNYELEELED